MFHTIVYVVFCEFVTRVFVGIIIFLHGTDFIRGHVHFHQPKPLLPSGDCVL